MKHTLLFVITFCFLPFLLSAEAPEVDNNNGIWEDNFTDGLGTSTSDNVTIDPFSGSVSLSSGQNSGSQTTVVISPPSFDSWLTVCLDATYSAASNLSVSLLNGDTDAPIVGFQNMTMSAADASRLL